MTFDQWQQTDQGRKQTDWATLVNAGQSAKAFVRRMRVAFEAGRIDGTDEPEPEAEPLEISYEPHPGPLRRALLARLAATGPQTVTELRELALTGTLFRPADVGRALSPLLARGEVTREPARGRLTGTTQIRLPG